MLSGAARPAPTDSERGSGVLSSVFGVVLFCGFLLIAAQVLLTLHRNSLVASATLDAAHAAARAGGPGAGGCGPGNEATAVAHAGALLGGGVAASATCQGDSIRVELQAPRPRLVAGFGDPTITRAVTVRVEQRQVGP